MLFPPDAATADKVWVLVRDATAAGCLGFAAKVQYTTRVRPAILAYMEESRKEELQQPLLELVKTCWPQATMEWKADAATQSNTYSPGYFVLQKTPGSAGLFVWFNAITKILGDPSHPPVTAADLLPPEHPTGSNLAVAHALVGDAWLRAAIFLHLLSEGKDSLRSGLEHPSSLSQKAHFGATNALLAQQAPTLLNPLLSSPNAPFSLEDLCGLHEHGRATVVEAVIYAVQSRMGGDDAPIRDLAQHLLVLSYKMDNWKGMLLELGGVVASFPVLRATNSSSGGGGKGTAVGSTSGIAGTGGGGGGGGNSSGGGGGGGNEDGFRALATLGALSSSAILHRHTLVPMDSCLDTTKKRAESRAAEAVLHALGLPMHADAGAPAGGSVGKASDANFKGMLLEKGGGIKSTERVPASKDTAPYFTAVGVLRGVELEGAPMPTKKLAEAVASAALLCHWGLVSPVVASQAFSKAVATAAATAVSASAVAATAAAAPVGVSQPPLPPQAIPAPLPNTTTHVGQVIALGGRVEEAIALEGQPAHAPLFVSVATLGTISLKGEAAPTKKRAQANAAEKILLLHNRGSL